MFTFDLQLFAHKKGVSSTRNGRDSESKRLGAHFHPGTNVGIGKDDTLFALVPGKVAFERAGRYNRKVSVYPVEA